MAANILLFPLLILYMAVSPWKRAGEMSAPRKVTARAMDAIFDQGLDNF